MICTYLRLYGILGDFNFIITIYTYIDSNFKIMPSIQAKQVVNIPPVLEQVNVGASTSAVNVIQEYYAEISDKDMDYTDMMPKKNNECPQNNLFEVKFNKNYQLFRFI